MTTISAGSTNTQYWRDLWRYRELFYFLVWRDILVRYKQTFFGVAWAVLRPLITMLVFTVIFGQIAHLPSEGIPYPLLVFVGMLPWQLFSNALTESSNSLISNSALVSKVYFPRLIIPGSSVLAGFFDFFISGIILVAMLIWYGIQPGWQVVFLPVLLFILAIAALGAGLWFSAINVKYRDFRYVVPFVVQLGLYISPVGFLSSAVPEKWQWLYALNPMVGVIDGFRWALLGTEVQFFWPGFLMSILIIALVFFGGVRYFRDTERTFADII